MEQRKFSFTSESVSEGHPDKIADQVSDAVLDAYLENDPDSKVACECLVTTGRLIIAGEVTSRASIEPVGIARDVLKGIGYTNSDYGFDANTAIYDNLMHRQAPEIHNCVENGGAGDQGLMFGYACNETPVLMPLPIVVAHSLMKKQSELRKEGLVDWLLPDAKSQVTVLYEGNKPVSIEKIVISTQHMSTISQNELREKVAKYIIKPVIEKYLPGSKPELIINPSGSFTIGGPHADTGLTGRKIISDTYGGSCPHGGGAFSGKDATKVDRSAAYSARYVAKHIVASGIAERCTVQIAYAIGMAEPVSFYINTHGTGNTDDASLEKLTPELFDLTPAGIIRTLDLKKPIYLQTSVYGHFGNDQFSWEKIDGSIIDKLKNH